MVVEADHHCLVWTLKSRWKSMSSHFQLWNLTTHKERISVTIPLLCTAVCMLISMKKELISHLWNITTGCTCSSTYSTRLTFALCWIIRCIISTFNVCHKRDWVIQVQIECNPLQFTTYMCDDHCQKLWTISPTSVILCCIIRGAKFL